MYSYNQQHVLRLKLSTKPIHGPKLNPVPNQGNKTPHKPPRLITQKPNQGQQCEALSLSLQDKVLDQSPHKPTLTFIIQALPLLLAGTHVRLTRIREVPGTVSSTVSSAFNGTHKVLSLSPLCLPSNTTPLIFTKRGRNSKPRIPLGTARSGLGFGPTFTKFCASQTRKMMPLLKTQLH